MLVVVVLVQLWWCGGVGAVVVASAVDRSTNTGCCHHQLELMATRLVDG